MGANAVTTVPVYTAGEVLTAADMNITNSGIPVFATTVTRDAAFGGAGEKTLAEGQFAYLEDSNTTQYYDGAAWQSVAAGVLQVKSTTVTASTFSTTSATFVDITGMSVSITPSSASNKVLVMATVSMGVSVSTENMNIQFARGGTAIGTVATTSSATSGTNDRMYNVALIYLDSPATTSATTYTVQTFKGIGVNTIYLNRDGGNTYKGISSITVMEVTP